jgi:MFS family permease
MDGCLSLVAFCAAFYLIKGGERAPSEHGLGVFRSLCATFRNGRVFVYLLMGFAGLFAFGIFGVFVPTKGEALGLEAWEIGLILTTGALAFSVSSYFTGAISEKMGRKLCVLTSLGLMILSGVGLIYADGLSLLMGFYVLFCLTEAVPYLLSFVYASEAFDTSYIGTAMGAFDSPMDLSLLIAPLLGVAALGLTGEMAYPLLVGVLPAFLALFVTFAFLPKSHAPKQM